MVRAGDYRRALDEISKVVILAKSSHELTGRLFSSKLLDSVCLEIGRLVAKDKFYERLAGTSLSGPANTYVYVVTRLQNSGGHTRIIRDLIDSRSEYRHMIFSTELAPSDKSYIQSQFAEKSNVSISFCSERSSLDKLVWLQRALLSANPRRGLFLLNNHEDSVAIAAVEKHICPEGAYIHHADHNLALGVYLPHFKHFDLHPYCYHICKNVLGIQNFYSPLSVVSPRFLKASKKNMDDPLITATVARSNKLAVESQFPYYKVIPMMLKATDNVHVHVGRLSITYRARIRMNLLIRRVQRNRFIYIPEVPSVGQALINRGVDVYLAPFPYGAGLTMIEVMASGIPVIIPSYQNSRLLSSEDIAYPQGFRWSNPCQLIEHLTKVTRASLQNEGVIARRWYCKMYSEAMHAFLIDNKTSSAPEKMVDCDDLSSSTDFTVQLFEELRSRNFFRFKVICLHFLKTLYHQLASLKKK
jgi:glycosyltransferase involved in cell wall biosynthesis